MMNTLSAQFMRTWRSIQVVLVRFGLPIVDALKESLKGFPPVLKSWRGAAEAAGEAVAGAIRRIADVWRGDVWPWITKTAWPWLTNTAWPWLQSVPPWLMRTLLPPLMQLVRWIQGTLWPGLVRTADILTGRLLPALGNIAVWLDEHIWPVLQRIGQWLADVDWTGGFTAIVEGIRQIPAYLETIWPMVKQVAKGVWNTVSGVVQQIIWMIRGALTDAFAWLANFVVRVGHLLIGFSKSKGFRKVFGSEASESMEGIGREVADLYHVLNLMSGLVLEPFDKMGKPLTSPQDPETMRRRARERRQSGMAAIAQGIQTIMDLTAWFGVGAKMLPAAGEWPERMAGRGAGQQPVQQQNDITTNVKVTGLLTEEFLRRQLIPKLEAAIRKGWFNTGGNPQGMERE
jgi:hypothetical protein